MRNKNILIIFLIMLSSCASGINYSHYISIFKAKFTENKDFILKRLLPVGTIILSYFFYKLYENKKKRDEILRINTELIEKRESERTKIEELLKNKGLIPPTKLTEQDISLTLKSLSYDISETWKDQQQNYWKKFIKRSEKYVTNFRTYFLKEDSNSAMEFMLFYNILKGYVNYNQYKILKPIDNNKLTESDLKNSPSETSGEDLIKSPIGHIDKLIVDLEINPYVVKIENTGEIEKMEESEVGGTTYQPLILEKQNEIGFGPVEIKINMSRFIYNEHLTPEDETIAHELGHVFSGDGILLLLSIPSKITNSQTYTQLRQCQEIQANDILLIRNKDICFNVLAIRIFHYIRTKNPFANISDYHSPSTEQVIHTLDLYKQVHKPPEKSYEDFTNQTKNALKTKIAAFIKETTLPIKKISEKEVSTHVEIIFNPETYEKRKFKLNIERVICDPEYNFLPNIQ